MGETLANLLDLDTAWQRARRELAMYGSPFELALIEQDTDQWLAELEQMIRSEAYAPSPMEVSELPKAQGIVRPIGHLTPVDRVVYTALVGAGFDAIHRGLAWSQGTRDFAYVLRLSESDPVQWTRSNFRGWNNFRRASLIDLDEGHSYVVFTDIAAFYENVDLAMLASDLGALGVPNEVRTLLSRCLNRWARVTGRGLPQGPTASNILAKVYLNVVDRALADEGILHVRYSDDIRLFAHTHADAQKHVLELGRLLRKRGLSLQAAKTEIARADRAREKIEDIVPILKGLLRRYKEEALAAFEFEEPYPELFEIDAAVEDDPEKMPIELMREAFQAYFVDEPDGFNKTLFHFLMKRLGRAKDELPLPHCRRFLERQPEETSYVLTYLDDVDALPEEEATLLDFLQSPQGQIYEHQRLQIIRWLARHEAAPSAEVVAMARAFAFDSAVPRDLRAVSRQVIGAHGTIADLERLEAEYEQSHDDLEQAQIILCLTRVERQRRNAFLARAKEDGELQRRAVSLVRAQAT
jgi:hypothetical protein